MARRWCRSLTRRGWLGLLVATFVGITLIGFVAFRSELDRTHELASMQKLLTDAQRRASQAAHQLQLAKAWAENVTYWMKLDKFQAENKLFLVQEELKDKSVRFNRLQHQFLAAVAEGGVDAIVGGTNGETTSDSATNSTDDQAEEFAAEGALPVIPPPPRSIVGGARIAGDVGQRLGLPVLDVVPVHPAAHIERLRRSEAEHKRKDVLLSDLKAKLAEFEHRAANDDSERSHQATVAINDLHAAHTTISDQQQLIESLRGKIADLQLSKLKVTRDDGAGDDGTPERPRRVTPASVPDGADKPANDDRPQAVQAMDDARSDFERPGGASSPIDAAEPVDRQLSQTTSAATVSTTAVELTSLASATGAEGPRRFRRDRDIDTRRGKDGMILGRGEEETTNRGGDSKATEPGDSRALAQGSNRGSQPKSQREIESRTERAEQSRVERDRAGSNSKGRDKSSKDRADSDVRGKDREGRADDRLRTETRAKIKDRRDSDSTDKRDSDDRDRRDSARDRRDSDKDRRESDNRERRDFDSRDKRNSDSRGRNGPDTRGSRGDRSQNRRNSDDLSNERERDRGQRRNKENDRKDFDVIDSGRNSRRRDRDADPDARESRRDADNRDPPAARSDDWRLKDDGVKHKPKGDSVPSLFDRMKLAGGVTDSDDRDKRK